MHAASVAARGEHRQRILDTVAHFRAKTVATNRESVTLALFIWLIIPAERLFCLTLGLGAVRPTCE
jgi:hypothetical protein